jgi:hypothetical protein
MGERRSIAYRILRGKIPPPSAAANEVGIVSAKRRIQQRFSDVRTIGDLRWVVEKLKEQHEEEVISLDEDGVITAEGYRP